MPETEPTPVIDEDPEPHPQPVIDPAMEPGKKSDMSSDVALSNIDIESTRKTDSKSCRPWYDGSEYKCNFCPHVVKSKVLIIGHVKQRHREMISRSLCLQEIISSIEDGFTVLREAEYICKLCGIVVKKNKISLKYHLKNSHKMSLENYEEQFETNTTDEDPLNEASNEESSPSEVSCENVCTKSYNMDIEDNMDCPDRYNKKENEFATDMPVVMKGDSQTSQIDKIMTKCNLCEYVIENHIKFAEHMISEHNTPSKKTPSKKTSSKKTSSKKSGGSPAVVKEGNFPCDREYCDYKASSKAHVIDHIRAVHDKIKAFACDQCSFRSSRKTHLKDHVKTKHDMIKDFACEQCNYKTTRGRLLKAHIKAVHDKILDMVCEKCPYRTSDAANLKSHETALHSTRRDFACERCEYKTYKKSYLQLHIKAVHLKIFDFNCNICRYATSQKGNLKLHHRWAKITIFKIKDH